MCGSLLLVQATLAQVLAHPFISSKTTPTAHLGVTIKNLTQFNARRKIKAAARAVLFGSGLTAHREMAGLLSGYAAFTPDDIAALSVAFHKASGGGETVNHDQFKEVGTSA
jgi:hypothetical protein